MVIEEGQAKVIEQFVIKLQLWKPPPLLPISLPLTLPSSLSPIFYLYLISSSFKELRILLILICLSCLLMEPGVITKVLSYNKLLEVLDVSNVRELEDFLIIECTYAGIVKGKLNQLGRCFEVQFAAGRDLMHGQLGSMIDTLGICWRAHATAIACNFQKRLSGLVKCASWTWITSRNFKVEFMKQRKIPILSPSRAIVSGKMLMIAAILMDHWNRKRIPSDPRGVTVEEGQYTHDVSPRGKPFFAHSILESGITHLETEICLHFLPKCSLTPVVGTKYSNLLETRMIFQNQKRFIVR